MPSHHWKMQKNIGRAATDKGRQKHGITDLRGCPRYCKEPRIQKGEFTNRGEKKAKMNNLIRALLLSIFLHALVLLIIVGMSSSIVPTNKLIVIDFSIEYLMEAAKRDLKEEASISKRQKTIIRKIENIHKEIKPIVARKETPTLAPSISETQVPVPAPAEQDLKSKEESKTILAIKETPEEKGSPTLAPSISETQVPSPAPAEQDLTSKNEGRSLIAQGMTGLLSTDRGGTRASTTPESSSGSSGDASEGSDAEKRARYLKRHFSYIKDLIQRNLTYPRAARKMGWEGKVTVSFVVCENGYVESIKIIETSGIWILDKNAVDTVRKVSPVPKPPVKAELIVPIVYKLE